MSGKASVSKEINARHKKILEGLLKLPENRECADCKANGMSHGMLRQIVIPSLGIGPSCHYSCIPIGISLDIPYSMCWDEVGQ